MDDIRELYQQIIVDHGKNPRNFGHLQGCTHQQEGFNPLCGDHLILCLTMDGDTVVSARFEGNGCAISTASASLMTQAVAGLKKSEIAGLLEAFQAMILKGDQTPEVLEKLEKLSVLRGVCAFPARVKCAMLAWRTLEAALKGQQEAVSTE